VHATTSKYPTDVGEGCFAWSHAGKAADELITKRKGERLLRVKAFLGLCTRGLYDI